MNWITNLVRPRIKKLMTKGGSTRETPENLWRKCSACGEMIFHRDLVANFHVCPNCGHHLRVGPVERFAFTFDPNSYTELPPPQVVIDPLRFKAEKRYADEMKAAKTKTA
ncbi:MAG: acetyl-CoA carboxylase carboxyl transferase subunit beta, partial [Rhizomicrobium sp.]